MALASASPRIPSTPGATSSAPSLIASTKFWVMPACPVALPSGRISLRVASSPPCPIV